VVHGALKQVLSRAKVTGDLLPLEKVLERTRARARAEWSGSREKSYWREASRIVGLVEHEYAEAVADAEWKRLYEQVIEGSLRAFYGSEVLEEIRRTPRQDWLTVDELDSWDFEGTRIWVAVDFALKNGDGRVHVLDWKTGKERGVDHVQVGTYALYARQKWGVPADGVVGGLVYLVGDGASAGERVSVAADAATLDRCREEMRTSIGAMRGALADPARNVAREDAFPRLEDRAACRRCPFRRPCGRL
jgi:CRISPR/Cas system-associated exonuclease Cas4 (RecB family)